jgi:hypothetical protein
MALKLMVTTSGRLVKRVAPVFVSCPSAACAVHETMNNNRSRFKVTCSLFGFKDAKMRARDAINLAKKEVLN